MRILTDSSNVLFLFAFTLLSVMCPAFAARPNILWISAEDINAHLGCYGDPHAITPNVDRLAAEGIRYTHAYTSAGVCAPCRSGIITGMYQNSIGTHHMRCNAVLPGWLKPFPVLLRKAGYYCTNNSKTDYQFSSPPKSEIWDESGSKAHWKKRGKEQPFFAVFNFTGCHESGIASESKYKAVTSGLADNERQDAAKLTTLPPYYPDTPVTREDWKRNYELITAMDSWAGKLIAEVKDAGLYEETIIFFWTDHGVGLPRAKRWLYESGTHIPLVVRIPGTRAGVVDRQLVSSVDFAPTVLNLAGVDVPSHLQGRAFLGGDLSAPRDYVYGARDRMDERYDIIRVVRGSRFRYIRNFEPLKPYYQYMNTPEKGATMREIRRAEKEGTLTEIGKLFSASRKPVEELYDVQEDPHEVHNLAGNRKYAEKLKDMRTSLAQWQRQIGDIGLIPEAEIEIREQEAGSRFEILNRKGVSKKFLERLVASATQASEGIEALPILLKVLDDKDSAVRYWGVTGIGNIGKKAGGQALEAARKAMKDNSPSVRIAAARAVARLGKPEIAIPLLVNELKSEHQWGRLAAAIVLDEMDEEARPALKALQEAVKKPQPNKYIVRVANRAVNDLLGTDNRVR
ncbi:MAG: sulfatase-like hydrolase/transferase [Verrucomicrobiaceae bacterium]|nr:sulfatase-like hydrolase/transferase [Verrucomicrobiaceae bacterium]